VADPTREPQLAVPHTANMRSLTAPRAVWFLRRMLWFQSALAAAFACWAPWVPASSTTATIVLVIVATVFAAANVLTAIRLGYSHPGAASGALLLEIFWTLIGALAVVWPSGAQGYYEPLYLLFFLASLTALIGLLSKPARDFLNPATSTRT
jgi:hypothetical protein